MFEDEITRIFKDAECKSKPPKPRLTATEATAKPSIWITPELIRHPLFKAAKEQGDLWGEEWTPEDVNNSDFGITFT